MPSDKKPWRIIGDRASISENLDDAALVLRLGIAANAIAATQRFYWFVRDAPGPAGARDRIWAFLVALGFIHEAIRVVRPNFPRIRELAALGGAEQKAIDGMGQLLSGRLPLNRTLDRMRNKLIFHWDDELIREYASQFSKEEVVWAQGVGDTRGESMFAAAADALTNSVLPDEVGAGEERNQERVRELVQEAKPAMELVIDVLQRAIMGHLKGCKTRLEQE